MCTGHILANALMNVLEVCKVHGSIHPAGGNARQDLRASRGPQTASGSRITHRCRLATTLERKTAHKLICIAHCPLPYKPANARGTESRQTYINQYEQWTITVPLSTSCSNMTVPLSTSCSNMRCTQCQDSARHPCCTSCPGTAAALHQHSCSPPSVQSLPDGTAGGGQGSQKAQ
jgi:hypothetical protein